VSEPLADLAVDLALARDQLRQTLRYAGWSYERHSGDRCPSHDVLAASAALWVERVIAYWARTAPTVAEAIRVQQLTVRTRALVLAGRAANN
jgi:hypothetical protein